MTECDGLIGGEPIIEFTYVKSQIDICDLNAIKKTFNFLNKN